MENGGSDPDAVWHHRSDGSRDEACRFGDRSTERGTFGGEFGSRHSNQWGLTFAATQPSSQITLGRLVDLLSIYSDENIRCMTGCRKPLGAMIPSLVSFCSAFILDETSDIRLSIPSAVSELRASN